MQQGDVLLQHTNDGGEIDFEADMVLFSGGLETACYISMFGGNEQDNGSQNSPQTWWGNTLEADPDYKIRALTAHLLRSIPAVPYNLGRIKNAVKSDLGWLRTTGAASSLEVSVRIPELNKIEIAVEIQAIGFEARFNYVENWRAYQ